MGAGGGGVQGSPETPRQRRGDRRDHEEAQGLSRPTQKEAKGKRSVQIAWIVLGTFWNGWAIYAAAASVPKPKTHERTQYFLDIEVAAENVWIFCNEASDKSYAIPAFYVLSDGETFGFHYRAIRGVDECRQIKEEYRRLIGDSKTVRIVGTHPMMSMRGKRYPTRVVPARFTERRKVTSLVFERLQAAGRCKSYFADGCELPENYWAGLVPE